MSLFKPAVGMTGNYRKIEPLSLRFWKHVTFEPNTGCWLWIAACDNTGYGRLSSGYPNNRSVSAHRLSFELSGRVLIDGMDIDHKCFVRSCVNPDHLEQVTRRENIRRGVVGPNRNRNYKRLSSRTHCIRGHAFTPETTHLDPKRNNKRTCKICRRARQSFNRAAKKGK